MAGANSDSYIGVPPTRYPGGVNNVSLQSPLHAYGAMDLSRYHTHFNDFDIYLATDWTITATGSGSLVNSTGADGGVLVVTNAGADNDAQFIDYKIESWKFVAGKKLWFKTRLKFLEVIQLDAVFGLQITDTTPLAVSDGVWFSTDDGDALLDFNVTKNATSTATAAVATLVADTYAEFAFYYNGIDEIEIWVDNVKVGSSAITNLVDDEELCLSFGVQNGEAVANVMSIDYFYVSKER